MKRRPEWFCSLNRSEEAKLKVTIVFLLLLSSFLSACDFENPALVPPTPTPSPTTEFVPSTSTPTPIPSPTLTPYPTSQYRPIKMDCDEWALDHSGDYQVRNGAWNKGDITDWHQCIGLGNHTDGTLKAQWTWDWPESDTVVSYPHILFGHIPPLDATTEIIPIHLSHINSATVSYEITSQHTGRGNVAFDLWLTDTQSPSKWAFPPFTHEIMIWIDAYGGMDPAGRLVDQVDIDGSTYAVYVAENFSDHTYIAFASETSLLGSGSINLVSFFSYLRQQDLVTGEEYLAAIELGNEIDGPSVGETKVNKFVVSVE